MPCRNKADIRSVPQKVAKCTNLALSELFIGQPVGHQQRLSLKSAPLWSFQVWLRHSCVWILHTQWINHFNTSPSSQNMFFLLVPAVERSSFAVQNDVCAEFETTKLFSHSLLKVGTFLCLVRKLILTRGAHEICDITHSLEANPGPTSGYTSVLWEPVASSCVQQSNYLHFYIFWNVKWWRNHVRHTQEQFECPHTWEEDLKLHLISLKRDAQSS